MNVVLEGGALFFTMTPATIIPSPEQNKEKQPLTSSLLQQRYISYGPCLYLFSVTTDKGKASNYQHSLFISFLFVHYLRHFFAFPFVTKWLEYQQRIATYD